MKDRDTKPFRRREHRKRDTFMVEEEFCSVSPRITPEIKFTVNWVRENIMTNISTD